MCLLLLCFALIFGAERITFTRREKAALLLARPSCEEFDVPLAMALAVIRVESNFYADAVSSAGARGLMQLMPQTFAFLCEEKLKTPLDTGKIDDPATNVRFGCYYLAYLYDAFPHWPTALAAYNAGEGRVKEWLEQQETDTLTPQSIPFPETQAYVKLVLEHYEKYLIKFTYRGEKT